jgi:thioredoxin-like negative regulator of GroEL
VAWGAVAGAAFPAGAAALAAEHELTFPVVADPHGAIAGRFGVRAWPTVVQLDADGRLADVTMGADPGALAMLERDENGGS